MKRSRRNDSRTDLPRVFAALVLSPGDSPEERALGIDVPTILVNTDPDFFRVARNETTVYASITRFAQPGQVPVFVVVLRISGHELRFVLDTSNSEIRACLLNDAAGCRIELQLRGTTDELAAITVDLDTRLYADALDIPLKPPTADRVQLATDVLLVSCRDLYPRFAHLPQPISVRGALIATASNYEFFQPRH